MDGLRQLGSTPLRVTPIGFGCWPIAGVSSLGVTEEASVATLHAALECGINFFDTAYAYGYDGEADRLLVRAGIPKREGVVIASKVGQYFDARRVRHIDGRPPTLLRHAQQVLRRLGVSAVDIMYLHQPDPHVPLAESAGAIAEIVRRGMARYGGVSNVDAEQLRQFVRHCPQTIVVQPPFNMLQQRCLHELQPVCQEKRISVVGYWVLMKGLLAGKLPRDHRFDPRDKRLTYPIFQGEAWQRAQDLLDRLREIAADLGCTVAQLVVAWTIAHPGVSVALCGAKRPEQIRETAAAMRLHVAPEILQEITLLADRFRNYFEF
ncbi:MAG: general stress protein [Pirellulaceae bacterium]|nr:MAG: general stress protein [Pirellulaceae bacterium]